MRITEYRLMPRGRRTWAIPATQIRKVMLTRRVRVVGSHISGSIVGRKGLALNMARRVIV
ncbi:hypothetical protein HYC85_030687 [Camellia sinensis]|uniref:Uncharacterized protein n=1 Tax=Camellia sinensis TaxID=4442 RepID=A0A7J7G5F4_CAMSI|nr:hypothetical protein HYC85_030687 [Camellia sinensis]